ncbi:MAG TPA: 2Fe-2S iron-sulfur cluster-binding protein [Reyranella sp.]|jgi:xanthine dehydrogenase YagT iron-sulfur-binding subunit|nr:2Fe-2S iron-sulfur cluster-binding protein [Reyranella sp.]
MSLPTRKLTVTINGQRRGPLDVPEGMMMIDVLHEMLDLTGSRLGCGVGICHACVVIWDRDDQTSEEVQTCITGADFFNGKRIRTIEGIARTNDSGEITALSPVQQAFLDKFSFQCGYCTPGFVNAATVLIERLQRAPVLRAEVEATVAAALDSHICRCTGYVRYYQAVRDVILATPGLTRDGA